jgi:hypothetical protein
MERRWRVNRVTGKPEGNNYTPPPDYYNHEDRTRNELRLFEIEAHQSKSKLRRVK